MKLLISLTFFMCCFSVAQAGSDRTDSKNSYLRTYAPNLYIDKSTNYRPVSENYDGSYKLRDNISNYNKWKDGSGTSGYEVTGHVRRSYVSNSPVLATGYYYAFEYWYYYVNNDNFAPFLQHSTDWEGVVVWVKDLGSNPVGVTHFYHNEHDYHTWGQIAKSGKHAQVGVVNDGHASYLFKSGKDPMNSSPQHWLDIMAGGSWNPIKLSYSSFKIIAQPGQGNGSSRWTDSDGRHWYSYWNEIKSGSNSWYADWMWRPTTFPKSSTTDSGMSAIWMRDQWKNPEKHIDNDGKTSW